MIGLVGNEKLADATVKISFCLLLVNVMGFSNGDTAFENIFYSNIGNISWQVDIDSMVSILERLGFDSCRIKGINNHFTVGPTVSCESGSMSLGIGYRWDKEYVPKLYFMLINFSNCKTCEQTFNSLCKFGYSDEKNAEPLEINKRIRYFPNDSLGMVKIVVWDECCPGNRLKIFRVKSDKN